jgi:hypothetical protein
MILVAPRKVDIPAFGLDAEVIPIPRQHRFGVFCLKEHSADAAHMLRLNFVSFDGRNAGRFGALGPLVALAAGRGDADHRDRSGERAYQQAARFKFRFHGV